METAENGKQIMNGVEPHKPTSLGLAVKLMLLGAAWWAVYLILGPLSEWLTYTALGLSHESRLGSAIGFFLYDAPKVMMLLVGIVFLVGIVNSFFTPERTRRILSGRSELIGNFLAAHLGIVTPFCSCS
ncbi:hypothetical protein EG829_19085, partial [bacterium]|nr:hypothetical protein [bacterium]